MVEAAGRSAAARETINTASGSTAAAMKKKLMTMSKKKQPEKSRKQQSREAESPSYRLALKSLFSCRNSQLQSSRTKLMGCSSAPSICKLINKDEDSSQQMRERGDVETACKRRASVSGGGSERSVKKPLSEPPPKQVQLHRGGSSSSSSAGGGGSSSFRAGMQLRRLSGCYECHMVVDPIFNGGGSSSMRATTVCPCPDCGEIFIRQESLHLHQSIRHAVSELGCEDTSRNIIEIIFQSSWLKKQSPKIERILKVHNTARTLGRFEEYRETVKARAAQAQAQASSSKHPRCTADGNELLRFHCATLGCELGLDGATHLCCSTKSSSCGACAIVRHGFVGGVLTMATSGRAHDALLLQEEEDLHLLEQEEERGGGSRAMLVCRVIAGRVKRPKAALLPEQAEPSPEEQAEPSPEEDQAEPSPEEGQDPADQFDSVASSAGVYSNLEELQVFNPRAILPCFVVVYKA